MKLNAANRPTPEICMKRRHGLRIRLCSLKYSYQGAAFALSVLLRWALIAERTC
jgi:hypothetical protein